MVLIIRVVGKEDNHIRACVDEAALSLPTYDRKVKSQVDHGAVPWSKMPLLNGAVRIANHHSGSHPILLPREKSSHNKNGFFRGTTAQDLAVNAQYHAP